MYSRLKIVTAALLGSTLAVPAVVSAHPPTPLPTCAALATDPRFGLAGNEKLTGITSAIIPATVSPPHAAYCEVDFTDVSLEGRKDGYLVGQTSHMRIRVGLPLAAVDGGTGGGVQGAWNGKVKSLGNGGFAGQVVAVNGSTDTGYVGTGTDTGHNGAITTPAPGQAGAAFGLNPDHTVNYGYILDFAWRAEHHANRWGREIAETYFGKRPTRNYFVGCSDGGREGHALAEHYPNEFDGIVSMSPAVGWERQQFSGGWGNYVANQELHQNGLDPVKFKAVNAKAIQSCDAIDGILDGLIQDTRKCHYDANANVCGQPGADLAPACLTSAEAAVVNKIWDGPRDSHGKKVWYGWERGVGGVLGITPVATGFPNLFGEQLNQYWVHRDPAFDWHTINETQFINEQTNLTKGFRFFSVDNPDLSAFRNHGGKLIASFGNQDQVIPPRGLYNYVQRVFGEMGGVRETQEFYRYFVYPGYSHCGMDINQQFNILVDWVEHDVKPDYIVNQYLPPLFPSRTRKICMYPNTAVYNGSGSTDDATNFHCQTNRQDDAALLEADEVTGNLGNDGDNDRDDRRGIPVTIPPDHVNN
jgi:pimeloyl-ACP methyl ester carboxylesterase